MSVDIDGSSEEETLRAAVAKELENAARLVASLEETAAEQVCIDLVDLSDHEKMEQPVEGKDMGEAKSILEVAANVSGEDDRHGREMDHVSVESAANPCVPEAEVGVGSQADEDSLGHPESAPFASDQEEEVGGASGNEETSPGSVEDFFFQKVELPPQLQWKPSATVADAAAHAQEFGHEGEDADDDSMSYAPTSPAVPQLPSKSLGEGAATDSDSPVHIPNTEEMAAAAVREKELDAKLLEVGGLDSFGDASAGESFPTKEDEPQEPADETESEGEDDDGPALQGRRWPFAMIH